MDHLISLATIFVSAVLAENRMGCKLELGWNFDWGTVNHPLGISAALTVLFPAVELGPIRGKYNVGVIDLHLPVDFTEGVRRGSLLGTQHQDSHDEPSNAYVTARLLYPTHEKAENFPYLDPQSATLICSLLMKAGAPKPIKSFGWILHTWRFTTIRAKRNAQPASLESGDRKIPLAVYSHGLTGNATIYSYQALNLAAQGLAVLMVDHTDLSAIAVRRKDSSHLLYDSSLVTDLHMNGKEEEYDQKRRAQTEHRVEEVLAALKVFKSLNRRNIPDLDSVGVSFVDKLDVSDVTMIGHSFGGCTVLAAAAQRPDLVSAVVAHEPVVKWMPDTAQQSLLLSEKEEAEEKKDGPSSDDEQNFLKKSIHDVNMLFLYSEEWATKGWGAYQEVKSMHERQELGPTNGTSEVGVIRKANHQEFSDTCMLTPLWLARATGLTGERNPHETAEEIACRTVQFLEATRGINSTKQ
eukprot:CAMPEP_0172302194 /NCGR_PEP_ID=MMETSP1058-20130122/3939_1 /TAXON_ID=83371 /ORGANISM="Detonula confervacea, Strain CCMP 353" /LENGTH=466 /DNA_ID=CAMNT_0013012585 /DNA_START=362 /DNA_END=1763 /DNA_ORIENTATION=-